MNFQLGLERVSAVWWALWGLASAALIVEAFTERQFNFPLMALGAGLMVCAYAAHRLTCWVVAGFFARRS